MGGANESGGDLEIRRETLLSRADLPTAKGVLRPTLMAQLQTRELLRRHELELQELLELEDVCRRTMEVGCVD